VSDYSSLVDRALTRPDARPFLQRLDRAVEGEALILPADGVLVACSGGPDSTALAVGLAALARRPGRGYRLHLAYLDHGIRPKPDTTREREHVTAIAKALGAQPHAHSVDVPDLARIQKKSVEHAARDARYDFLERLAVENGCDRVAIAHHRDDQVETIMQRVLRGTGIRGLSGMPERRPIGEAKLPELVRPLLRMTKRTILAFLTAIDAPHCFDQTNRDPDFSFRNRIRLKLLPVMRELAPDVDHAVVRMAYASSEAFEALRDEAEQLLDSLGAVDRLPMRLSIPVLQEIRSGLRTITLQLALERATELRLRSAHVAQITRLVEASGSGGETNLPGGIVARREYDDLVVEQVRHEPVHGPVLALAVPGNARSDAFGVDVEARRVSRQEALDAVSADGASTAAFDATTLASTPLCLRRPQPGDSFRPTGMRGRKKLSDYFSDAKIPRPERAEALVVGAGGDVIWIVGRRQDRRFQVTEETQDAVLLRVRRGE